MDNIRWIFPANNGGEATGPIMGPWTNLVAEQDYLP